MRLTSLSMIEPLGLQLGVWPKRCVPEPLADLLFGDVPDRDRPGDAASPCATWAVLDAACVPNLPEELEASGLAHRCLFRGKAQDDWGHVAPWLVALRPDARLTRRLFTAEPPFGLWDAAAAMFLRSRRTMDDLWRHFRKYTRIQDDAGSWLYFRFWDAQSVRMLQKSVADLPEARRFFAPCELVLAPVRDGCLLVQPQSLTQNPAQALGAPLPLDDLAVAADDHAPTLPPAPLPMDLPPLRLQQPLDDLREAMS